MDLLNTIPATLGKLPLGDRLGNLVRKPGAHESYEMTMDEAEELTPEAVASLGDLYKARKLIFPALLAKGKPLDDRSLLMEKGVELLQRLPLNSKLSEFLAHKFIAMLWRDLPHPAGTNVHQAPDVTSVTPPQLGDTWTNSRFRSANGSNNNLIFPTMGMAGTPYARSVPPGVTKPTNLPDPELVYDKLLRRRDQHFEPHPRGLNRLFFSFATVVIHECFQTSDLSRPDINGTTSYVDLSTLYGNNEEEQQSVRTNENGTIYPDSFASRHIAMMPPGVIAVLIMFSRNHNHIAKRLFEVNEGRRYKAWESLDADGKKKQDEMIFQFARNINVGFFATIVLKDYVSAILATKEANSEFWLNLGAEIHDTETSRLERGTGLQNTAEFNVLYRWHSTLSASDAKWMEQTVMSELRKDPANSDKTMDNITPADFWTAAGAIKSNLGDSPQTWSWPGYLVRNESTGRFDDDQLASLIKSCIEEQAHRFGARAIPSAMRIVDVLGQILTRDTFFLSTMNEFRRYLNLKTFDSFEEWNSDKSVAQAARELYSHIDNLEIYPGLLAEDSKPAVPGSGLCPGHTIGRAILADAVQLVRGDRFLTFDFNASTLTNWGAQQLTTAAGGSYGGLFPLLLERNLPNQFGRFNAWALMPFHTPAAKLNYLTKNGVIDKYITESPRKRVIHATQQYLQCKSVLEKPDVFKPPEVDLLGHVRLQYPEVMTGTNIKSQTIKSAVFGENVNVYKSSTETWVRQCTRDEIAEHSIAFTTTRRAQLDVVRDICNNVPMRWLAHKFGIPLKSKSIFSKDAYSVRELQQVFTDLFTYSNFDGLTADAWQLRENAKEQWHKLNHIFRARIYRTYNPIIGIPRTVQGMVTADFEHAHSSSAGAMPPLGEMLRKVASASIHPVQTMTEAGKTVMQMYSPVSNDTQHFYTKLMSEATVEQSVDICFAIMVPLAATVTRQLSLVIDLFLEPKYARTLDRIVHLVKQDTPANDRELTGLILDAMRLRGVTRGLPRIAASSGTIREGKGRLNYNAGDTLMANLHLAHRDPAVFDDAEALSADRNAGNYAFVGCGPFLSFGNELMLPVMLAVVKEVFTLPGLRRARNNGKLTKLSEGLGNPDFEMQSTFLDQKYNETNIPSSMTVEYNTPAPPAAPAPTA